MLRKRTSLYLLIMMLLVCGAGVQADDCPGKRDFNNDCRVDILDLQMMVEHWLSTPCVSDDCMDVDLTEDGIVNLDDLVEFAEDDWLDVGVPIEINEVLAHSHDVASDWIELYNPTDSDIDLGGWYLSDDNTDETSLKKYRIADGTIIKSGNYKVFYENSDFGNVNDNGTIEAFGLSERGEVVYLSSAHNGVLTGYTESEDFGGSESGISFGRYYNPGSEKYNFVAMASQTRGRDNGQPKVGPIVVNEVMYHAEDPQSGDVSDDDDDYDYIELHNITGAPVNMYVEYTDEYGETYRTGWILDDAITHAFSASALDRVAIPAYGYLVLVKNLQAFNERYTNVPAEAIVMQWDDGKLKNSSEQIDLIKPGDYEALQGGWYMIRQDRMEYDDEEPWPDSADGDGDSLCRQYSGSSALYGNDWHNWYAGEPTPGAANVGP